MPNMAAVHEAIAAAVPDREALVFRDRRYTYAQMADRTRRFANVLLSCGIKTPVPREDLAPWQSGQAQVALYLYNGNEYPEAMLGAMKARAAPFNVNYRYVADELRYLLANADTQALVYHQRFAPVIAEVLPDLPPMKALIQVEDGSGEALLPGAMEYEAALSGASSSMPDVDLSADDLYILYTGGTTGMPKGVLWRQGDILAEALGGRASDGQVIDSPEDFAARAARIEPRRYLPTPPFMHGTAQWIAFSAWHGGHTVIIQDEVERFDAASLLAVIARENVNVLSLVGDALGRPFLDALEDGADASSLTHILNGGAAMSSDVKTALLKALPEARIIDTIGSSEAGPQARVVTKPGERTGKPAAVTGNLVLSADLTRVETPGHEALGWLAKAGRVPLGYLGDEDKTRATFPVINGVRYAAPGDRVRLLENGDIDFHGRDSSSINTGGEKVFAQEVEEAVGAHPGVADVLVGSRPSQRWGREVVAVVEMKPGMPANEAALITTAAERIARYKLPKAIVFVDRVERNPNGKPDYAWANAVIAARAGTE